jgi:HSP20 family protein
MTLVKFNRRFPTFFDDFLTKEIEGLNSNWNNRQVPAVNIREDDNQFKLEVAAPGLNKDDFKIELEDHVLTISYEHKSGENQQKNEQNQYQYREFRQYSFKRSFNLPKAVVDEDQIKANYENGVLHLSIPKKEEAKPKPARLIDIA